MTILIRENLNNMKNNIKIFFAFALLMSLVACKKDAEVTMLGEVSFPRALTASTNALIMNADNDSVKVIDFQWQPAVYGIEAPVTYSLQFDNAADTSGANAWSGAFEMPVGDDVLTAGLMGYEVNTLAVNNLGLEPGTLSKIAVRVKSFVDRAAYSNTITIDVNPFLPPPPVVTLPSLWVPGDYQGWDPATAPTIASAQNDSLYAGFVNIPEGNSLEIKYTAQPAWEPMAYGDGGNGTLIEANFPGANILLPEPGYYQLSADLKAMTWTAIKTTWSIIGDATPGGWSTDTPLEYDPENQVWTVTANMITAGSFKFRANNAWTIAMGIDAEGNLQFSDNPLYPYNPDIQNITVPSDGSYTITLDLHTAGQYTYKLKKN